MHVATQDALLNEAERIAPLVHPNAQTTDFTPRYILLHQLSQQDQNRISPHLVLTRKGEVLHTLPFDQRGHHAGPSNWKGLSSLDHHAIGIAIICPDSLTGPLRWRDRLSPAQQARLPKLLQELSSELPALREVLLPNWISVTDPAPDHAYVPELPDLGELGSLSAHQRTDFGPLTCVNTARGDSLFLRAGPCARFGSIGQFSSGTRLHLLSHAYSTRCDTLHRARYGLVAAEGTHTPLGFVNTGYLTPVLGDPLSP